MKDRIYTDQLNNHVGEDITLKGWLHTVRKLGSIAFLILRDKNGLSQIVLEEQAEIEKLDNANVSAEDK